MLRWLFPLASLLSLLLCLATVVLWIRGYRVRDEWLRGIRQGSIAIESSAGEIQLGYATPLPGVIFWFPHARVHTGGVPVALRSILEGRIDRAFLGFLYQRGRVGNVLSSRDVIVPDWCLVLLFGAEPAWRLSRCRSARARQRLRAGLCLHCGYDLRATADRCPECGRIPQKANVSA